MTKGDTWKYCKFSEEWMILTDTGWDVTQKRERQERLKRENAYAVETNLTANTSSIDSVKDVKRNLSHTQKCTR
jgi:hypothetical protein